MHCQCNLLYVAFCQKAGPCKAEVHKFATRLSVRPDREYPADQWRQVRQPALLIYGERDERIPVEQSIAGIRAAASNGGHPAPRIEILPGARHAFDLQTDDGAWPRVAPGYPELIVEYVTAFRPQGTPPSPE